MPAGACAERSRSKRATSSRHPDAKRKGPVNSRYRNTRNDWMFQGFAPQHDEDAGRTRHPERSEGSS